MVRPGIRVTEVVMATDPVCGMEVDPAKAAATSEYKGHPYYFCAEGCARKFNADPGKYLGGTKEPVAPPGKQGFWSRLLKG